MQRSAARCTKGFASTTRSAFAKFATSQSTTNFPKFDNLPKFDSLGKAAFPRVESLEHLKSLGKKLPDVSSVVRQAQNSKFPTLPAAPTLPSAPWTATSASYPELGKAIGSARVKLLAWTQQLEIGSQQRELLRLGLGFLFPRLEAAVTTLIRAKLLMKVFLFSSVTLALLYPTVVLAQNVSWLVSCVRSVSNYLGSTKTANNTTTTTTTTTAAATATSQEQQAQAQTQVQAQQGGGNARGAWGRGEDGGLSSWLWDLPQRWWWSNSNRRWAREVEALATLTSWNAWP